MTSSGDTTSAPAPPAASRWEEPARAYAATLLEPAAADAALHVALDVLGARERLYDGRGQGAQAGGELGDDVALTVVRDAVAKRVPRPAPIPASRRGAFRRSTPPRACSQMPELLAARAASRLSPADVGRVAAHLDSCPVCDALESRMAEAERAFRRQAEQAGGMAVAPVPAVAAPDVTTPFEDADRQPVDEPEPEPVPPHQAAEGQASAWLPGSLREAPAAADIRASRGPSAAGASPARAWLIESAEAPQGEGAAPAPTSPAEWLVSDTERTTPTGSPQARPAPPGRRRRRRALRLAVPALLLALVAGGALAATGTLDTSSDDSSSPQVDRTPPPPDSSASRSTAGSRTPLPSAAARRRAARRTAAGRRAAERRRDAARRAPAAPAPTAPQSGAPTPTPAPTPAPVVRTPAPAPTRPTRPSPPRPSPPPQTTAQPPTSDAPKPSPPSSEPGRQPPPS